MRETLEKRAYTPFYIPYIITMETNLICSHSKNKSALSLSSSLHFISIPFISSVHSQFLILLALRWTFFAINLHNFSSFACAVALIHISMVTLSWFFSFSTIFHAIKFSLGWSLYFSVFLHQFWETSSKVN